MKIERAPGTGCGDVRGQLMSLRIMLLTVLAFSTYNPEHNHTQRYAQPRSLLQSGVRTWERAFIVQNIPLTRGKRTLHVLHLFVKNIIKWTPTRYILCMSPRVNILVACSQEQNRTRQLLGKNGRNFVGSRVDTVSPLLIEGRTHKIREVYLILTNRTATARSTVHSIW